MFRVFLLLVTASLVLVIADWQGLLDGSHGSRLASSGLSVLDQPQISVLSAPPRLILREPGSVEVRAAAPATPGETVILETPGSAGLGYTKVSKAVLDGDLRATLALPGGEYLGTFSYWASVPASATHQEGRSSTFAVQVVTAPPPPAPTCGGTPVEKADGTPWQCTYDDEFDGTTLDRRYWVPQVTEKSGFTTGTRSMYACGMDSPQTISVAGGYLDLSLVRLPAVRKCGHNKSSQYAFGQVMHYQTFSQTYGRYEVRARIPDVRVPGVQESFWLWPNKNTYGAWPASGEMDFAELYSSAPDTDRPYLHYLPGATAANTSQNVTTGSCPINPGEFNTYGLEWRPKQLTILLNGQVCFVDDYSSATAAVNGENSPFDQPFYLALTQAMGAIGNKYDPAVVPEKVTTQIDYVRIWK